MSRRRDTTSQDSPEALRRRIAETRADLREKLARIKDRLFGDPHPSSSTEERAMPVSKTGKGKSASKGRGKSSAGSKKSKSSASKSKSSAAKSKSKSPSARSKSAAARKLASGSRSGGKAKKGGSKSSKKKGTGLTRKAKKTVKRVLTGAATGAVEGAVGGALSAVGVESGSQPGGGGQMGMQNP
jgi:hypothetical protein